MTTPHLEATFEFPLDDRLPGLPGLFNAKIVWELFCSQIGEPEDPPEDIHPRYFAYRPGSRALVGYVARWPHGNWVLEEQFAVEISDCRPGRVFRYPDDPHLPGLPSAASPLDAQQLITKHLSISPHRLRVEVMRYRPGARAVLRHIVSFRQAKSGKLTFFARVVPPERVERLVSTAGLANLSGFNLPKIAGSWPEGGVVWVAEVKGETIRTAIKKGRAPETGRILAGLHDLWTADVGSNPGNPLNVAGGFAMTKELLSHLLPDGRSLEMLDRIHERLGQFAESWRPTNPAHNDFYDDQLLVTPEDKLVLVDFEESGPGEPMMDVGNLLAHLRWMSHFDRARSAFQDYHDRFREDALARFGWDPEELNLREAYSIYRLVPGPIRSLRPDWPKLVERGLRLATEAI